jgi:tRNA pseudouridine38-40 synthase
LRYKLTLSYNGGGFSGWAKQPSRRTVQEELELALAKVVPHQTKREFLTPISTIVAGRTDAGVHARNQIVHFDSCIDLAPFRIFSSGAVPELELEHSSRSEENHKLLPNRQQEYINFLHKLNSVLPEDIVAKEIEQVPDDFSARFWATSRVYKYRICDNPCRYDPIHSDDVALIRHVLDVDKMNQAVKPLVGLNDFSAFVKPRKGQTAVRDLFRFDFERNSENSVIVATLHADAFAYNMVRSLVGSAILVGLEKRPAQWIEEKLKEKTREGATGPTAAKGLTFDEVRYDLPYDEAREREKQIKAQRAV